MKEFYALLQRAREALPLKLLLEQHGQICPWCGQQSASAFRVQEQHGLILPDCIEQIRERSDIVALVQARTPLKKSGGNFTGCCPFHSEKSPSFTVHPKTQSFHCFGCQKNGSAIDFVVESEGIVFVEAVKRLARWRGWSTRRSND